MWRYNFGKEQYSKKYKTKNLENIIYKVYNL